MSQTTQCVSVSVESWARRGCHDAYRAGVFFFFRLRALHVSAINAHRRGRLAEGKHIRSQHMRYIFVQPPVHFV
jgi:hypothetical protein